MGQTATGKHVAYRFYCSYQLYQFLVTDGMGRGRPVMFAFVQHETNAALSTLFEIFKRMMGGCEQIRTMVMDKMAAQIRAARVTFNCDIVLCYFHVRQAIAGHVS